MLLIPKIIVLATSRYTHGGISSVVMAHEQTAEWKEYACRWIATHRSGSKAIKIIYFLKSLLPYVFYLPWAKVVHVHTSEPPSARRKLIFVRLALALRKKVIVHFHAFDTASTIESPAKEIYRELFTRADRVVVLSPLWRRLVEGVFGVSDRYKVLFNPCPTIAGLDRTEARKTILFAGVLNARKGYDILLKAFAEIAGRYPDWKLVFAGSGEIDAARTLAADLGIEAQVEFKGWVAGGAKDKLFREAGVFCLPSYAEGFPMAVLEAWAYGLPVVATPVGGLPDIVKDGEEALLFEPGDAAGLSHQLDRLLGSADLRDKLSAESLRLSNEEFKLENIGHRLGELYESLLESK